MSQIYKVLLQSGYDGCPSRIVAIRPGSDTFEGFVDAIFMRFPDLNRKKLELFYNDTDSDRITIMSTEDFDIFKQRRIFKVVAVISNLCFLSYYVKNKSTVSTSSSQERISNENDYNGSVPIKQEPMENIIPDVAVSNLFPSRISSPLPNRKKRPKRQKLNKNAKRRSGYSTEMDA